MPIAKEISDMLDIDRNPSQAVSVVFLTSKIAINRTGQVFPLCDDYFRWVSPASSIAIARNDRTVDNADS